MTQELNVQGNPYAEVIDPAACTACGICFRMCPDVAIEITGDKDDNSDSADQQAKAGKAKGNG